MDYGDKPAAAKRSLLTPPRWSLFAPPLTAVTGAYLSSGGNAFTTRTASQIIQEHFNPGEKFAPGGPLFGVQFSQLPCSDLSVVFPGTNAVGAAHEESATVGPKRSPLGLSADPGGLPLYKNGTLVGGVGVEADAIYTLDLAITDFDSDIDEILAVAGQAAGFEAPKDIRANRIFLEGKSFRYTDVTKSVLVTNPTTAVFNTIAGLGAVVTVTGYFDGSAANAASFLDGQTYSAIASGFAADNSGTFDFVGRTVFILFNNAGNRRFEPTASTLPTVANGGLTANEVTTLIGNALNVAFTGRAAIRRPLNSHIQVTVSIVDGNGNVLGIARTPDGPIFGTDVSLQKARTAALFSSSTAANYLGTYDSSAAVGAGGSGLTGGAGVNVNGVILLDFVKAVRGFLGPSALANGIAFADRSGGNLSRPFFPDGIDTSFNGPLSRPFEVWSPFNTGLQLDVVIDQIAQHIRFADDPGAGNGTPAGGTPNDARAACTFFTTDGTTNLTRIANGFQIFPGSVPIYRNARVIGGIGVSGDGVDQDDMVSFLGLNNASAASNTGFANAPRSVRADNLSVGGSHLRYVNCPVKPFLASRDRNPCFGK